MLVGFAWAEPAIRSIKVEVREIFDEAELASIYRTANSLKINSREHVIRRELLFKEGDTFNQFLLDESERLLRRIGFLGEVKITSTTIGDNVDVLVRVQDSWTFIPQLAYSTGDGSADIVVGIAENNLLGFGKRAEVLYANLEERKQYQFVYDDNRLLSSDLSLLLARFEREDGYKSFVNFSHPLRSLADKEAWAWSANTADTVNALYGDGEERFIFRQQKTDLGFHYTLAKGRVDKDRRRFTFGYRYIDDRFNMPSAEDFQDVDVEPDSVSNDPDMLADDRRFSLPFFAYSTIAPDYFSSPYVDRFERVQDINLGRMFYASLGVAPTIIGSRKDTALFSTSISRGIRNDDTSFWLFGTGVDGRIDGDGFADTGLWAEAKYVNILGRRRFFGYDFGVHTIVAGLAADMVYNQDRDREFLLGAENGLRGYESRAFFGDRRFTFSVEERFHLYKELFKVVSVGGAFFFDAGGVTQDDFTDIFKSSLYSDVGFGLRLGFPRSSGGRVLRLEVALPLRDGDDGSSAFEPRFLIKGGLPFGTPTRNQPLRETDIQTGLD